MPYFVCQCCQVLSDQMVAIGMKQNRETPRIAKRDKTRFPWVVVNANGLEARKLLLDHLRSIKPSAQLRIENWQAM